MSRLDGWLHRFGVLLRPRAHERELEEEFEFHLGLERMQQQHAARGELSGDDARRVALRHLGNATYYKEETRRTAGLGALDDLRSDIRFALRTFRRAPGFTAVAVLTLAVGIGANTAVFSAINALLIRPLPFPEPERLVTVNVTIPPRGSRPARVDAAWSIPKFEAIRDAQTALSDIAVWLPTQFTVRVGDEALRESGEFIDSRYFPTLGVRQAFGRNILEQEDRLNGPRVALISDELWHRLFNADSSVLDRTITVDGSPYDIIGVMPEGFSGLSGDTRFWIPVGAPPSASWPQNVTRDPWNHMYHVIGRLKPGISLEQGKDALREAGRRMDAQFPAPRDLAGLHFGATIAPLNSVRVDRRLEQTLFVLFGAVGLVLLIACANVANLFLVRASGRRREIAVRLAIGAGRGRLVRQLLVESVVLSVAGGAVSLLVAWWGVTALSSLEVASVLRLQNVLGLGSLSGTGIRIDRIAFAFTAALAIGTGFAFGLVPALQATRFSVTSALKDDGNSGATGIARRFSGRNALVIIEMALAIVLLAGSGLMLRSLGELLAVRPGFSPDNLLTLRVNRAPEWARDSISRFFDVALERVASLPGVTGVAVGDCPPLNRGCYARTELIRVDRPREPVGLSPAAGVHWITPEWPRVAKVPLLRGRLLARSDDRNARKAVLISESAAKRIWPNEDPIGRPVGLAGEIFGHDTAYVVGVLGDVRFGSIDSLPQPDVYVSYYQSPMTYRMMLFISTRGDPWEMATPVRNALREVAPGFPVYDIAPMERRVASTMAQARFSATLLGTFAALALVLAAIGTYGVISFGVAQRTNEIGVRVALGATSSDVVRLIVGQGITLACVGTVCGLAAAVAATRALRSLLYGVEPTDPVTLLGIVALLMLAVLAASWIPARRAAEVPAVQALRGR